MDHALDPERATIAERLRREGYATGAVVANPVLDGRGFGFARGFDRYLELAREWKNRNVNSTPADAALVTDAALHWIGEHTDRPSFLYVHSIDLNYPYLARAGFEGLVRVGRSGLERDSDLYDSELAYTDRELGRLLDGVRRLQLDQRTTILVTADHGEEFGEHGSARHGHTLFDTPLHVPMILKLAGRTDGRRIEDSVAQVDVMPTLLELARAPAPLGLDGVPYRHEGPCARQRRARRADLRGPARGCGPPQHPDRGHARDRPGWAFGEPPLRFGGRVAPLDRAYGASRRRRHAGAGSGLAPFDLRLGSKGEPATRLPMPLSPAALRVAVPPADMEGARAWAFAVLSERRPEVVSPELQEQMRALGYLQ